jgi:hypothetical protein
LNIELLPNEVFTRAIFKNGDYIRYLVSNYSRVYSLITNRLLTEYITDRGYHRVNVTTKIGDNRYIGTYYLCLMSFIPIKEIGIYVPNHIDGNTHNNLLSNLEWVTVSENTRHAIDIGLSDCKCDHNSRSVLSNEQVHYICSLIEQGYTNSKILDILGYEYGAERNKIAAVIRLIRRGQTYLDISTMYNIPGINGRRYYPPEFTKELCDYISTHNGFRIDELCDYFGIELNDRKMFANYVQDVTRRQKDTYITNSYPILNSPLPLEKSHPLYKYYY